MRAANGKKLARPDQHLTGRRWWVFPSNNSSNVSNRDQTSHG
jgi:hypothetical protein